MYETSLQEFRTDLFSHMLPTHDQEHRHSNHRRPAENPFLTQEMTSSAIVNTHSLDTLLRETRELRNELRERDFKILTLEKTCNATNLGAT